MSQKLFIKTEKQQAWLNKLEGVRDLISQSAQKHDEENSFPHENIEALRKLGYTKITLPEIYGGDGFNV